MKRLPTNRKWSALIPAAITAVALYWSIFGFAQPGPQALAPLFPSGALLYLEAKDFGALLAQWNAAEEKKTWLESASYQAFQRSQLLLRLSNAQTEFAAAAGLPADYSMVESVAGGNSALAMYRIGDLEFLYVTRLPQARLIETGLWKERARYQSRNAGGATYYVKTDKDSRRVAAFAAAGDLLILATKEELIGGALELLARSSRPAVVSEPWFAQAVQSAAPGAHDLRLVYNLERLTRTPQFRRHWLQRNVAELAEFASGLTDLEKTAGEIRERRVLLRATPAADRTPAEAAAGQLAALVPDDAALYRVWAQPTAEQAARTIEEKLFGSGTASGRAAKEAPTVAESMEAGAEENLETRIDEPPLADDRGSTAFWALRERLTGARLEAMLDAGSTRADQVFVRGESAIVLLARDAWNGAAIEQALSAAAGGLWSSGGLGAGWRTGVNGVRELDGLGRLALAVDGRRLILGTSAERVAAILARRNRAANPGAVYAAEWRHARELPNFERIAGLIDFPHATIQSGANANNPVPREPLFFSENLASLGRVLRRVQSAAISVHDSGSLVRESVVYRLAP
jgi:hypothetical protein